MTQNQNNDPQQRDIIMKEYGRNVQMIVDHILTIEDREKRTRFAHTLIHLMKQINPHVKEINENDQRLWDHLYIMSDFRLDVDSEFPMPERSILGRKPMKVEYNLHHLKFKHYGRNIELLIERAINTEDPEEKEAAIIYVGKLMKRFYSSWNKENIEDEMILSHLEMMSGGKLTIDIDKVKANHLFDSQGRERDQRERDRSDRSDRGDREYSGRGAGYGGAGKRTHKRPFDKRKRS